MVKKIIFATANQHKIEEVQSLAGQDFALLSMAEAGIIGDIPETAGTLEGNAMQKAEYVYHRTKTACFADDTGLEIDALGGEPGVYSARYAGEEKNSKANMDLVLAKLEGISNRKARFRTVIAYIDDNGGKHLFEGIVNGEISLAGHGQEGFGYDPIFIPEGCDKSFAQMKLSEKNLHSHRARALKKFTEFLNTR